MSVRLFRWFRRCQMFRQVMEQVLRVCLTVFCRNATLQTGHITTGMSGLQFAAARPDRLRYPQAREQKRCFELGFSAVNVPPQASQTRTTSPGPRRPSEMRSRVWRESLRPFRARPMAALCSGVRLMSRYPVPAQ